MSLTATEKTVIFALIDARANYEEAHHLLHQHDGGRMALRRKEKALATLEEATKAFNLLPTYGVLIPSPTGKRDRFPDGGR